ncbi:MAG: RNA 2',3'-cyclic phosphodiesterase [Candidatus Omnitrophica bacterium]|nr:RNA 2',3'-cyclic phosphodiesterase [Candidatus Omnitrophota bacterium]
MRIFIGIEIPENLRENLKEIIEKIKKIRESKPVKIENLHITLKFLGEIEEKKISLIKEKLKICSSNFKSFNVEIKGLGSFPSEKNLRVLWIGVEDDGLLKKLKNKIEEELKEFGFEEEKEFISHITIARFKSVPNLNFIREIKEKYKDFSFGKFLVKDFHLYESKLTPEGPIYKKIEKFEFL